MLQGYIKKFNKNKLNSNLEVFKSYITTATAICYKVE